MSQNAPLPKQNMPNSSPSSRQNIQDPQIKLLRTLLIISIVTDVAAFLASIAGGFGTQYSIPVGSLLIFAIGSYFALMRGYPLPTQILLPSSLFIVLTYIVAFPPGYGLHDINLIAYALVISLASLTLGRKGALAFSVLIVLAVFGIGIAELRGLIVSPVSPLTLPISPFAISIIVLAIMGVQWSLMNVLNENTQRARASENLLAERNTELKTLSEGLEKLVAERTAELEQARVLSEHRAKQFEAIAQTARAISTTQDLAGLLDQITEVVHSEFGFYHVGIFLVDTAREYAVLSAANSDGGQRMLANGHRLRVGETGMVGYVTSTGKPRIALDTGADATFFDNPELAETRSAITLPLMVGGNVMGALDVQSTEANAFGPEDMRILNILADQISIAIQNTKQNEETRKALAESEVLTRQFVQTGWRSFTKRQNLTGVRHTGATSTLLYTKDANGRGETFTGQLKASRKGSFLSLPLKLRGEVIGSVNVQAQGNRQWDNDELDIVKAIIERATIAMENARLLAESQKRAAKERTIGEISAKISAQSELNELLKVAAQELNRTLPGSQISIQFKREEAE